LEVQLVVDGGEEFIVDPQAFGKAAALVPLFLAVNEATEKANL